MQNPAGCPTGFSFAGGLVPGVGLARYHLDRIRATFYLLNYVRHLSGNPQLTLRVSNGRNRPIAVVHALSHKQDSTKARAMQAL